MLRSSCRKRQRERYNSFRSKKVHARNVKNYGTDNCKPVKSRIDINISNPVPSSNRNVTSNDVSYHEVIGCLLYISQVT